VQGDLLGTEQQPSQLKHPHNEYHPILCYCSGFVNMCARVSYASVRKSDPAMITAKLRYSEKCMFDDAVDTVLGGAEVSPLVLC